MGRIFSTDGLFAGEIPTKAGFQNAERLLKQELPSNEILSAAVFGSVAAGTHTPRSDLDVFVVAKAGASWRLHSGRLASLRANALAFHVPVQLIVLDEEQAARRGNGVGPGLRSHLKAAGRRIVGTKDPWTYLTAPDEDAQAEAQGYLGLKRNRLQQDLYAWRSMAWSKRIRALERALDGPVHLAWKIVHVQSDVMHAGRMPLLEAFQQLADAHARVEVADMLARLLQVSDAYTARIFAQPWKPHGRDRLHKEFPSVTAYESFLESLWNGAAPNAWEFYNECDAFFP